MTELVSDCPRCGAKKTTFDVHSSNARGYGNVEWQLIYETFSVCRHCHRATVFILKLTDYKAHLIFSGKGITAFKASISHLFSNEGYLSLKDTADVAPPDHLPPQIEAAFREGATCLAVKCFNAAGTMFRLGIDLATKELLPPEGEAGGPNSRQRRDLGLRLQWLFDNRKLPQDLHEMAQCIKEDGNDGAHRGTLSKTDAEDLLDFSIHLLEQRYTLPQRVIDASARRAARPR